MSMYPSTRRLLSLSLAVALCLAAVSPAWAAPRAPGREEPVFAVGFLEAAIDWLLDSPLARWLGGQREEAAKVSPGWDPNDLAPRDPDSGGEIIQVSPGWDPND